jgi:hypothetical protein
MFLRGYQKFMKLMHLNYKIAVKLMKLISYIFFKFQKCINQSEISYMFASRVLNIMLDSI